MGTQIIASKLGDLSNGNRDAAILEEIATIAEHIRSTSLCGLGQTAPVALLEMLSYLREELVAEIENGSGAAVQPCTTYVSARASRPARPRSMYPDTSITSKTASSPIL